jgi:hypothetical protein
VESLDTATEHLGGLCDGRNISAPQSALAGGLLLSRGNSLDGEVGLTDHLGGAARCEQADIVLDEALGQVEQAGLVVDGQDGWALRERVPLGLRDS